LYRNEQSSTGALVPADGIGAVSHQKITPEKIRPELVCGHNFAVIGPSIVSAIEAVQIAGKTNRQSALGHLIRG
jgi:hypothetical protein